MSNFVSLVFIICPVWFGFLAKVGVEGSNPFTRSNQSLTFNLINRLAESVPSSNS